MSRLHVRRVDFELEGNAPFYTFRFEARRGTSEASVTVRIESGDLELATRLARQEADEFLQILSEPDDRT